jgi:transposase
MPGKAKGVLALSDDERATLVRWARRATSSQALALRARIVLACADGMPNTRVAEQLGVSRATVGKWRSRFVARRLEGLSDGPRPGAPRKITDAAVEEVVRRTMEGQPPDDTHWSTRSMAKLAGLNQTAISRIWRAFGLKPHPVDTWRLSTDPRFIDYARDIAGLYLDPPFGAMVLAVDERSQQPAADPAVLMTEAAQKWQSHDDVPPGPPSPFAAIDAATAKVIGPTPRRHRNQEFLHFLRVIDKANPAGVELHLVLDNYATHKTPQIHRWLVTHPRFHLHFTPTYSSWLDLVDRWFAELTKRTPHRGVAALESGVRNWIDEWNDDPKPFTWSRSNDP